jgi:hypothetical protein
MKREPRRAMQQCRIGFQPVSGPNEAAELGPFAAISRRDFCRPVTLKDRARGRLGGGRNPERKNTRDNPDGIALALPFRASVLGGDDLNLVGDGAFGSGGIVGGENEEVGGTAFGQLDGVRNKGRLDAGRVAESPLGKA